MNLRLFDGEGGSTGTAGNGGEGGNGSGTGNGSQGNAGATYSFSQAEEIANARAARAEKAALSSYFKQQGMSETEISEAIKAYKVQKASQAPDIDAITKERDEALAEVKAMKNSQSLAKLGVKSEDADYVTYKVNAMVAGDKTGKLTFAKAAEQFLKENPRYSAGHGGYRVTTGTQSVGRSSGGSAGGKNDAINNSIRRAFGR